MEIKLCDRYPLYKSIGFMDVFHHTFKNEKYQKLRKKKMRKGLDFYSISSGTRIR